MRKNLKFKSILYSNGDELVEVVVEILQEILDVDMSSFKDVKKEDFLIKKDNMTFIGEIKGINSNVKNSNISQLENHYHNYVDELVEGTQEKVKQILIINPLRGTDVNNREPIHKTQIDLAIRNKCLIIETKVLLSLFERYKKGTYKTEDINLMFTEKIGLLLVE